MPVFLVFFQSSCLELTYSIELSDTFRSAIGEKKILGRVLRLQGATFLQCIIEIT